MGDAGMGPCWISLLLPQVRGWQRGKNVVWFVGDSEPLWDTVPSQWDPLGHWSSHTPPASLPLLGVSPKVGDVETTRAGYGVSFLLHSQHSHSLGGQSPLQRQSHHLLFHQHPSGGWECNHAGEISWKQPEGKHGGMVEQKCLYFTPISHLEDGEKRDMGK